MERIPGMFTIGGVDKTSSEPAEFSVNGRGLIVKIWACTACGMTRIIADDQED